MHNIEDDGVTSDEEKSKPIDENTKLVEQGVEMNYSYLQCAKEIGKFAAPYTLSRVISIAGNFLNAVILGNMDAQTLAASGIISSSQSLLLFIPSAWISSSGILAGRAYGRAKYDKMRIIFQDSLLLGSALCVPLIITAEISGQIFKWLKQEENIIKIIQEYFQIYGIALLPSIWLVSQQQMILAVNKTPIILIYEIINNLLTTGIGYILVTGKLGLRQFGASGLAISNVISIGICLVGMIFYIGCHSDPIMKNLFKRKMPENLRQLKKLFLLGAPIAMFFIVEIVSVLVLNLMAGWLGSDELSAQQIALQYATLFLAPMLNFSQSAGILISQSVGEKKFLKAKRRGITALFLSLTLTIIPLILFASIPASLANLFIKSGQTNNKNIVDLSKNMLLINGFGLFADVARFILVGNTQGYGSTAFPFAINIVGTGIIGLSLSYLFGFSLKLGLFGTAIGRGLGSLVSAIGMLGFWIYLLKRTESTILNPLHPDQPDGSGHIYTSLSEGSYNPTVFGKRLASAKQDEILAPQMNIQLKQDTELETKGLS